LGVGGGGFASPPAPAGRASIASDRLPFQMQPTSTQCGVELRCGRRRSPRSAGQQIALLALRQPCCPNRAKRWLISWYLVTHYHDTVPQSGGASVVMPPATPASADLRERSCNELRPDGCCVNFDAENGATLAQRQQPGLNLPEVKPDRLRTRTITVYARG
jgi:hypothetical protein